MILSAGFFQSISIPALALLIFCVAGILGSGKLKETVALLVGLFIAYALLILYGGNPFSGDDLQTGLKAIPFLQNVFRLFDAPSIHTLFSQDFHGFLRQMLNLLLLSILTSAILTVSEPLSTTLKNAVSTLGGSGSGVFRTICSWIAFFLPWLVRYTACIFGMWAYIYLEIHVLRALPEAFFTALAYVVFLAMIVMLLSPLLEFLLLSAKVIPIKFLTSLSNFVKEHKMGGVFQSAFYATFFLILLMMILQDGGALNSLHDAYAAEMEVWFTS